MIMLEGGGRGVVLTEGRVLVVRAAGGRVQRRTSGCAAGAVAAPSTGSSTWPPFTLMVIGAVCPGLVTLVLKEVKWDEKDRRVNYVVVSAPCTKEKNQLSSFT